MAAVKNPPSPTLRLAVRIGKLVAWERWARFVRVGISLAMCARTGHSSADHREVRTALSLSPPVVPLGPVLVFLVFFMESNLRSRVAEFEAGYFLHFDVVVVCFGKPALLLFSVVFLKSVG